MAPFYNEPLPLVPGEYKSPAGFPEAIERGLAAYDAELAAPRFAGTINGIELGDYDQLDKVVTGACAGGRIAEDFEDVALMSYAYLPPGTAARGPQIASRCENGTLSGISQELLVFNASFAVRYRPGKPFLAHDAPEGRVSAASINGAGAVVVRPLTDDGFGRSWAGFETGGGLITIEGRDLPLDEVLKIAEGVKCGSCD